MFVFKKRNIITAVIVAYAMIGVLLIFLSLIFKNFVLDVILHTYLRIIIVPLIIKVLKKNLINPLNDSLNKALNLCTFFIVLDLVIVDAVRFILSKGSTFILFLPICIPICFMIIMFYTIKDTKINKKAEKRLMYIIGIPLLLLSLYIEILSFVQILKI